jgi:hypothetical protein
VREGGSGRRQGWPSVRPWGEGGRQWEKAEMGRVHSNNKIDAFTKLEGMWTDAKFDSDVCVCSVGEKHSSVFMCYSLWLLISPNCFIRF